MTIVPRAGAGTVVEIIHCGPRLGSDNYTDVQTEDTMHWDQVQGSWNHVKGKAKQMWGDLTDDELDTIAGERDELVGRLHQAWHQQGESTVTDRQTGSESYSPSWLAGKSLHRAAESSG
jgi:uncharacterized protein YjbJ (UPF0337 family)